MRMPPSPGSGWWSGPWRPWSPWRDSSSTSFPSSVTRTSTVNSSGSGFPGSAWSSPSPFIVPPAALVLVWILSRSPQRSLEGALLVLISIWVTAIEQVFPPAFRAVPIGFLTLGLFEYGFAVTGPEVTLANILLIATAITSAGYLLKHARSGSR